ncbi:unnamed protein product [marine sediment metagenome]|uniref:RNA polymerase sigma factor n=1 Tax=marine sediment metagenome TaxID=412755 RepID=X0VWJ0_9ZZZZ
MAATDNDCIKLCLNGHPNAFQQLVRRYQAPLLSYLVGRTGDMEQAEEVAQETFVRAFFALARLKALGSFFSWLLGIANRVAKEQQRAEYRYREAVNSLPPRSAAPPPSNDPALEQALAELPARYVEVVLLRYYGELSCMEVADRLGVPLGTVTKRLSRAYSMLRESLREHGRQPERLEVQA